MAGRYVGFGKKLFDLALGRGKSNVSTTIVGVNPVKNLTTKRKIQDNVTEAVDTAFKKAGAPPSIANQQKKSKLKKDEGKKLKGFSYKLDEIQDKIDKRNKASKKFFNKGGRVGLKRGTNLGMQSVKYGLDNNPKITAADPKAKFIAANKKKKSKTPISQSVRKA